MTSMSLNLYPDDFHNTSDGNPTHSPEIDDACDRIHSATKTFRTDKEAFLHTLGSRSMSERSQLAHRYKEKYGKGLYDLMKKETSGNFGELSKLLSLPIPEAEARIIRIATKGLGTNEELLWSVLCGRSNEEIRLIKKAYFQRYQQDLTVVVHSKLGGDLRKLIMACLQEMEEMYDATSHHTASKSQENAELFYRKGQGQWGTDESGLFEIICKSPPQHLMNVDEFYVTKYNVNLEGALKKELSGKAKEAALFHLGMKLNPYETIAKHIMSTCAGMGTEELKLSCAILRYQHVLPRVMMAHSNLFGETLQDLVRSETRGHYRALLLEMIRVVWPDAL